MDNNLMPSEFNPVVPDEYFARTSNLDHFVTNMKAWRQEDKDNEKKLTATQQRMIYKYMLSK
jgi:hypothetical protein